MHKAISFTIEAVSFSIEKATPTAVTWWFGPFGGFLAAGLLWLLGVPMTFSHWLPDNVVIRGAFDILVCVVFAYVLMFVGWLIWFFIRNGLLPKIRASRVQGWHLIVGGSAAAIICLIVILVGVIWHFVLPPHMAARSAQAGNQAAEAAPVAPKPLKQMFTAYDIEQRLRAIDALLGYLDTKLMQVSAQGEKLNDAIYQRIQDGSAIGELDKFADAARLALTEYFALTARFQVFPDIYEASMQQDVPMNDIPNSASLLRAELQEMIQRDQIKPGVDLGLLFKNNKLMHDWRAATAGKFWNWINRKKNALIEKRRAYESAPVYPAQFGA